MLCIRGKPASLLQHTAGSACYGADHLPPPPSVPSRPSSCGLACYEALPAEENSEQANAPGRSATGPGPVWSRPNRAIRPAAGVRTRTNSDIRTRHQTGATDRHTDRRVESDRGYNFSKLNERRAQRVKSAQGTIKILSNSDFSTDLTPFSNHYWSITQRPTSLPSPQNIKLHM